MSLKGVGRVLENRRTMGFVSGQASKKWRLGCVLTLITAIGFAWFLGFFHPGGYDVGIKLEPVASLTHPKMEEVSGLVVSSRSPNLLWAHNDSGNEPRLFCVSTDGDVILPTPLKEKGFVLDPAEKGELFQGLLVKNSTLKDWEAITRSGQTLYISEMGNNLNASKNLGFYEVEEPDPAEDVEAEASRFVQVQYPDQTGFPPTDQWSYDCEAVFASGDFLYALTKNRPAFRLFVQDDSSNLYRLDLKDLKEVNTLTKVDQFEGLEGWVTACDLSFDGQWLALLCESPVQSIWLFQKPIEGDRFFSEARTVKRLVFHGGGQLESLAFAEHNGEELLVMLNEEKDLFRIHLNQFEEVER